jgi:hypothetical protein
VSLDAEFTASRWFAAARPGEGSQPSPQGQIIPAEGQLGGRPVRCSPTCYPPVLRWSMARGERVTFPG